MLWMELCCCSLDRQMAWDQQPNIQAMPVPHPMTTAEPGHDSAPHTCWLLPRAAAPSAGGAQRLWLRATRGTPASAGRCESLLGPRPPLRHPSRPDGKPASQRLVDPKSSISRHETQKKIGWSSCLVGIRKSVNIVEFSNGMGWSIQTRNASAARQSLQSLIAVAGHSAVL